METQTLLELGDSAPDFTLPSTSHGAVALSAFRGKKVLIAFYPKVSEEAQYQELFDLLARIE